MSRLVYRAAFKPPENIVGNTTVEIPRSAIRGSKPSFEKGLVWFTCGPDGDNARLVMRQVTIAHTGAKKPAGYQDVGSVSINGQRYRLFVKFPTS